MMNESIKEEIHEINNMIDNFMDSRPSLNIAVLGPGEKNENHYPKKCYNKRCDIKDALSNKDKAYFFEELYDEYRDRNDGDEGGILPLEINMLSDEFDIAIMIYVKDAPGVDAELKIFAQYDEIRSKLCVYKDETHTDTERWDIKECLDQIEGGMGKIRNFKEEEIDNCNLLTRVLELVEKKRNALSTTSIKRYKGGN